MKADIKRLVREVADGDLVALAPLLDALEEAQDTRWARLMEEVGVLWVDLSSTGRISNGTAECPDIQSIGVERAYRLRMRSLHALGKFRRLFDGLFWVELEDYSIHTMVKEIQKTAEYTLKVEVAYQQHLHDQASAWEDQAKNEGEHIEYANDPMIPMSPNDIRRLRGRSPMPTGRFVDADETRVMLEDTNIHHLTPQPSQDMEDKQ